MITAESVKVGGWYQLADGRYFKIVSLDGIDETVEIQYGDGDLEELELEYWYELEPMPIENPDCGNGPFDVLYDSEQRVTDRHTLTELLGQIDYN